MTIRETGVWITVRIMWFPLRVSDDKYSLCVVCLIMTHSRGSRCQWIPARRSSWSSRRAGWCNGRGGRTHWTRCATPAFGCHWLPRQRCSCQSLGVTEVRKRGEMISMADGTDGKSWKSELQKSFCWGKSLMIHYWTNVYQKKLKQRFLVVELV